MKILKEPPFHLPLPLSGEIRKAVYLSFMFLVLLLSGSIILDQATKLASESKLMVYSSDDNHREYQGSFHPVFILGTNDGKTNFLSLNFSYVRNPGAAWGSFANIDDKIREPLFHVITVFAVGMIFLYMLQTPFRHRLA